MFIIALFNKVSESKQQIISPARYIDLAEALRILIISKTYIY